MRHIDLETWPRRDHFQHFSDFDYPHFSLCANVDLTTFHAAVKQRDLSFTVALVYVLARVANAVPEFRQRIRAGGVVEHEVVHPSVTILTEGDLFSFCQIDYVADFPAFAAGAAGRIARVKTNATLKDPPGRDDLLFMTAIPWVSFTSLMHPLRLHPADSIPRFAWGKFFRDGEIVKMPLSVQGHHALMDGIHAGRFYAEVQNALHQPGLFLGEA